MCGIFGYLGSRLAIPLLLEGLYAQEYRGYDSAGIAVLGENGLRIVRKPGKIAALHAEIGDDIGSSCIGIGHTRWATHGRPTESNSHPHNDCTNSIAVVHNGIIENFAELREQLKAKGHQFKSQTDTEVLPHLLEEYYQGDLFAAMQQTVQQLEGSYATVAMHKSEPQRLVAARYDNPLIIGLGEKEYFFASDMAAVVPHTRNVIILKNGDIAVVDGAEGVRIYNQGQQVKREITYIAWDKEAAQKGGFDHFMLKEIHEQPLALSQTMKGRIDDKHHRITLDELSFSDEYLRSINKIVIVACGTAYHAGMVGKNIIEALLRIPVDVDIASEFQYRDPILDEKTLSIVISQSGETMDTLLALRECRSRNSKVIAICNVVDSTISREADYVLYTQAGPEIAVASTKAYTTQLMVLYLMTLHLAQRLGRLSEQALDPLVAGLRQLPQQVKQLIEDCYLQVAEVAKEVSKSEDAFFLGRGYDYCVALEGALKLKEISYIHAEAYAAGELKHGTIALIAPGEGVPVIAVATQPALLARMVSSIQEVSARDARVIGICVGKSEQMERSCAHVISLPEVTAELAPILAVIPLQLLAYYAALERGCDVDQPRCLAKSVTVT